jgi:diguanylate cyclase (GGDEF)-like protein
MATVLVVDDIAINRQRIVTLVTDRGHRALEAADGAEALALARKERPDLVICDILMPTMDGYEFVRQLRREPAIANTEVIFYSANYREQQARNLARACGVARVLIKPAAPEEIIAAIEQALDHQTTAESSPSKPHPTRGDFDREQLRVMTDKLAEKAHSLEFANQRLSALIDLNIQLASERDPHALLDKLCRGARDLLGAKYAVLCVKDKTDGDTVYSTATGIDAATAAGLTPPTLANDAFASVINARKARRFVNPGGDPQAIGLPAGYPSARSALVCPVTSLDATYGWICLSEKLGTEGFSEDDEQLLSIHTAQVGRIYEIGALYTRMQRHATQLQESEARLRESEVALRRAQLMAKLAHVITRPDGSFESWSETLPLLLGVDPTAMPRSAREWLERVHPDDRGTVRAAAIRAASTGLRQDVAYRMQRDADWSYFKGVIEPIKGKHEVDGPTRWFSTLQDVTSQRQAEDRIRRQNRVYAVLSGINALIVRARDRDELFNEACRIAVEAGQFRLAWIGLVDRQELRVKPIAWHGAAENYIGLMSLGVDPALPTFGMAGRVVAERRAMVTYDMTVDPRVALTEVAAERGFRALAMLPLLASGEVNGVIALYADEVGFFDAEEMKLLLELAGDIAFGLDHIAKEERLHYLAYYDTLTGLANRTLFRELLAEFVEQANLEPRKFAVVFVDVDAFKTINDSLGRQAGDELLKEIASRLGRAPGRPGTIARMSADRFGVVLHEIKHETDLSRGLDELISRGFGAPFVVNANPIRVAAKCGIALYPRDGADADTLLRNAEVALRKAKATGGKRVFYTQEMTQLIAERIALESRLRQAIEREEFVLHYQPKVDVESRQILGVEALIRWQSPDLGLVPPLKFISVLEETGMIHEVGSWVLRRAILDHKDWLRQKLMAPRVAVNVSAIQLRQADFVDVVRDLLRDGATRPGIDIEITESLIMDDVGGTTDKLKTLRDVGVSIAIDDFGTGYSSLAYLARLPVHSLKIDRSFIVTMSDSPDTMTLVSTIISLAHSLRLKVCAEGVETEEQAKVLRLLRCDEMQGYLISRPVPLDELTRQLAPSSVQ